MADSILRLKVESQEYDAKLKRAAEGLQHYADSCRKVGGTLEYVEKDTLDFVKAIGQMETVSRSAAGQLSEMKQAFVDFSLQYKQMSDAEKAYISFHYLLDICIYREKQLLEIKNRLNLTTHLVNDAIDEYLSIVRESWQHAATEISDAKRYLKKLPNYSFCVDEDIEKPIPVTSLLESLFHYLSSSADFDDSQFLQAVFIDISQLIKLVNVNTYGKKPKVICKEYYESTYRPTFGISRCDNCGEPLYDGFHYCFNCFERS